MSEVENSREGWNLHLLNAENPTDQRRSGECLKQYLLGGEGSLKIANNEFYY
jgi:hypothetical protein